MEVLRHKVERDAAVPLDIVNAYQLKIITDKLNSLKIIDEP